MSTKLAQVSYPTSNEEDEVHSDDIDSETAALDDEVPSQSGRRTHYKGKGRAWKKTEEDEDRDYRSQAKPKPLTKPKRKVGRRRSNQVSEDIVRDDEREVENAQRGKLDVASIDQSPSQRMGKQKRRPRKINHLSEEFVKDDSKIKMDERPPPQLQADHEVPKSPEHLAKDEGTSQNADRSIAAKSTLQVAEAKSESPEILRHSRSSTPSSKAQKSRELKDLLVSPREVESIVIDDRKNSQNVLNPVREQRKRKSVSSDDDE